MNRSLLFSDQLCMFNTMDTELCLQISYIWTCQLSKVKISLAEDNTCGFMPLLFASTNRLGTTLGKSLYFMARLWQDLWLFFCFIILQMSNHIRHILGSAEVHFFCPSDQLYEFI